MKIIHFRHSADGQEDKYICRKWGTPIKEGCWTWHKEEVTCKNCLKKLSKRIVFMQRRRFNIVDDGSL